MNTADKKLLKLAAKAAGIPIRWDSQYGFYRRTDMQGEHDANYRKWNPLEFPEDAFDLMVRMSDELKNEADKEGAACRMIVEMVAKETKK